MKLLQIIKSHAVVVIKFFNVYNVFGEIIKNSFAMNLNKFLFFKKKRARGDKENYF